MKKCLTPLLPKFFILELLFFLFLNKGVKIKYPIYDSVSVTEKLRRLVK